MTAASEVRGSRFRLLTPQSQTPGRLFAVNLLLRFGPEAGRWSLLPRRNAVVIALPDGIYREHHLRAA